jgi:hypothetical protein
MGSRKEGGGPSGKRAEIFGKIRGENCSAVLRPLVDGGGRGGLPRGDPPGGGGGVGVRIQGEARKIQEIPIKILCASPLRSRSYGPTIQLFAKQSFSEELTAIKKAPQL